MTTEQFHEWLKVEFAHVRGALEEGTKAIQRVHLRLGELDTADRLLEQRVGAIESDVRELKSNVDRVEGSSAQQAVTLAQAGILVDRAQGAIEGRRALWRGIVIALVSVVATAIVTLALM